MSFFSYSEGVFPPNKLNLRKTSSDSSISTELVVLLQQGRELTWAPLSFTLHLRSLCNAWTELISKALITWLQSCCRSGRLILPIFCLLEGALSRTGLCSGTASPQAEQRFCRSWAGRWKGVSCTHAYNNQARRACWLWRSAHRQDHRHPQDPHYGQILPRSSGVQQAQGRFAAGAATRGSSASGSSCGHFPVGF